MKTRVNDVAHLNTWVLNFAETLGPGATATLVTLSGDLGAGKTAFTQAVARALGVEETVASPTYVIEKIYALTDQKWQRLVHIDAYRLKSSHELEVLGWHDILTDPNNLILLEWPERVVDIIPTWAIAIRFDIEGEGRIITTTYGEKGSETN